MKINIFKNEEIKLLLKIMYKQSKFYGIAISYILIFTLSAYFIPMLTENIYDELLHLEEFKNILFLILFYFIVQIIATFSKGKSSYWITYAGIKTVKAIRLLTLHKIFTVNGCFSGKFKNGDVTNRILNEVEFTEQYSSNVLFSLIADCFTALFIYVILLFKYPIIAMIITIYIPFMYFIQTKISNKIKTLTLIAKKSFQDLANCLNEIVSNLMGIITINSQNHFITKYQQTQKIENDSILKLTKLNIKASFIQNLNSNILLVIILLYGSYLIATDSLSVGGLISLNLYLGYILSPVNRLLKNKIQIKQLVIYINRLFELINYARDFQKNQVINKDTKEIKLIEFQNLNFSYNNVETNLKNISFQIQKGEKVAIVGKSGSGKSTIAKILFKLFEVPDNQVFINGIDINHIDTDLLREKIDFVAQDTSIFNDTFEQNICLGKIVSKDKIESILNKVCLSELIEVMPLGLMEELHENGKNLSGGEKQRVALARMVCSNRNLVFLDEATSSLDSITEDKVLKHTFLYLENKTLLFITHKLDNIKNFDKIIVMEAGKIVDTGTHYELLESCAHYKKLYEIGNYNNDKKCDVIMN